MTATSRDRRNRASGQDHALTAVDRFGVLPPPEPTWRTVGSLSGLRVVDIGCGYYAPVARALLFTAASMTLVEVAISPVLRDHPKVRAMEGRLLGALRKIQDGFQHLVICNSVMEHLWEPADTLREVWRKLTPGGRAFVSVPPWWGKRNLEFSACHLGTSPPNKMQDRNDYCGRRDLRPLLVRAGFSPRDIQCGRHNVGLNTFAACRKASAEAG
jgi:2-polyprenyl-3-methyl-5-hydroxy-6-metoxy-1,4-benzoquinol methylase